ncbi:hypothetical protein ACYBSK_19105 [Streptomyces sp. BYX5S]
MGDFENIQNAARSNEIHGSLVQAGSVGHLTINDSHGSSETSPERWKMMAEAIQEFSRTSTAFIGQVQAWDSEYHARTDWPSDEKRALNEAYRTITLLAGPRTVRILDRCRAVQGTTLSIRRNGERYVLGGPWALGMFLLEFDLLNSAREDLGLPRVEDSHQIEFVRRNIKYSWEKLGYDPNYFDV